MSGGEYGRRWWYGTMRKAFFGSPSSPCRALPTSPSSSRRVVTALRWGDPGGVTRGKLRFWFDPQGDLYVVCEEAMLEEVSLPHSDGDLGGAVAQWTFQADSGEAPTVAWLLDSWIRRERPVSGERSHQRPAAHQRCVGRGSWWPQPMQMPVRPQRLAVQTYGPIDGAGFGIALQSRRAAGSVWGRLLRSGDRSGHAILCAGPVLCGQMFLSHEEWVSCEITGRAHQGAGECQARYSR